jgi:hypothetical protein
VASGLSLLIQVDSGSDASAAAGILGAAPTGDGGNPHFLPQTGPQILHYVWAVDLTAHVAPNAGINTILLTTVYDEDFESYISELVLANPEPFNAAAEIIVGLKGLIPVQNNLAAFINFVREHDLTYGGKLPFSEAYTWSVVQIVGAIGNGQNPAASDGPGMAPSTDPSEE